MVARKSNYPGYEAALEYLIGKGAQVRPRKGQEKPTEAYVKRAYGSVRKYDEYGLIPSRSKLRGHGEARIEYLPRLKKRSAQYRTGTRDRHVERIDAIDLLNKADPIRKGGSIHDRKAPTVTGSFTGQVVYRDPVTGEKTLKYRTLSFVADVGEFLFQIRDTGDMEDFARELTGYEWHEVVSLNILES